MQTLAKNNEYAIPDILLEECVTGEIPASLLEKLKGVLRENANRVWVVRNASDLRTWEDAHRVAISPLAAIHPEFTVGIRRALLEDGFLPFAEVSLGNLDRERRAFVFDRFCAGFAKWITDGQPSAFAQSELLDVNRLRGDPVFRREWIRDPGCVRALSDQFRKYFPRTRGFAPEFPDRFARDRAARAMAWYAMDRLVRIARPDDFFKNDVDDYEYAVISSYVGTLATSDKRLRQCVADIFPNVHILDFVDVVVETNA